MKPSLTAYISAIHTLISNMIFLLQSRNLPWLKLEVLQFHRTSWRTKWLQAFKNRLFAKSGFKLCIVYRLVSLLLKSMFKPKKFPDSLLFRKTLGSSRPLPLNSIVGWQERFLPSVLGKPLTYFFWWFWNTFIGIPISWSEVKNCRPAWQRTITFQSGAGLNQKNEEYQVYFSY